MLDIARGLEYLHLRKPSVIHRDCKSSNILITSKGVAKITDFGLAKVKESTRSMVRSVVGTVNWQAPELWHPHPKYNHKVDVFSCAMVYWEVLQWYNPNKKYPWEGMNEHAIYDAVGAKRQRCVRTSLCIYDYDLCATQTFCVRAAQDLVPGDCRPGRAYVAARTPREAYDVRSRSGTRAPRQVVSIVASFTRIPPPLPIL